MDLNGQMVLLRCHLSKQLTGSQLTAGLSGLKRNHKPLKSLTQAQMDLFYLDLVPM